MGEYTGSPVTVYETKSWFAAPEDITVGKLRDLLNDDDFSCDPDASITIGKSGEKRDGLVELRFTYPILHC